MDESEFDTTKKYVKMKGKRKRFTQTTIFDHFKAKCEDCGTRINLTTHHKNSNPSDISLNNLEILCITCHRKREGMDKKKKDLK